MKINSSLLAILLLLSRTTLWTRISVQGLELALLSSVVEWGRRRLLSKFKLGGFKKCYRSRGHPNRRHRRQETERGWLGTLSLSFGFSVSL